MKVFRFSSYYLFLGGSMSLLKDADQFSIILSSIRDYKEGENDIPILIVEKISEQLIDSLNKQISTQDILDEVTECYDFYNNFIKHNDVDLNQISEDWYDLVEVYLNEVVKEVKDV